METITFKMTEKLMEQYYKSSPLFFEEDGGIVYNFDIDENLKGEKIEGVLHIYENKMILIIIFSNSPHIKNEYEIHSYKELTSIITKAIDML